jgi:hypothetical protein
MYHNSLLFASFGSCFQTFAGFLLAEDLRILSRWRVKPEPWKLISSGTDELTVFYFSTVSNNWMQLIFLFKPFNIIIAQF